MIVVAGTGEIKPGLRERAEQLIAEVVRETRKEPGCISYTFYFDAGNPNGLHVFEEWESEEAVAEHLQQDYTQRFLSSIGDALTGPPDIKRYDVTRVQALF